MYQSPSVILGFHGCCEEVRNDIISNPKKHLKKSENTYDWLGGGIYFWDNNYDRALEWAVNSKKYPSAGKVPIKKPSVIGAIIELGNCLDLMDSKFIQITKMAYHSVKDNKDLPVNIAVNSADKDKVKRHLDCHVIETVHSFDKSYDSVRGAFFEGKPLYQDSGFRDKNHIQICIRNSDCIKGYFIPII